MAVFEQERKRLAAIEKKCLFLIILLSLVAAVWYSGKAFWGIIMGGVTSLLNIRVLVRIAEAVFTHQGTGKLLIVSQYVIKVGLLFGLVYFLVTKQVVSILAFLIGFSVLLIAALIECLYPYKHQPTAPDHGSN